MQINSRIVSAVLLVASCFFLTVSAEENLTVVKSEKAAVKDIPLTQKLFGETFAINDAKLSSEIAATVEKIAFKEGEWVEAGTPLVILSSLTEKAALEKAQAEARLSELEYQRTLSLSKQKAVAQHDVDTAKSTLDAHRADQAAAEALLAKTEIRASFAGRVGSRLVSVGDFVSPGTPLVTLVDNHLLKLRYDIAQKFVGRLALGQTATFHTMAYPDKSYTATVDYISPKIDNDMRTVQVEATLEDPSHQLSPGLSGEIIHTFGVAKEVLTIPEEAVMSAIDGESVYKIVQQEKALVLEKVLITIGGYADGRVIVDKGLALGDEVVTEGQQKCRDGLHVQLQ